MADSIQEQAEREGREAEEANKALGPSIGSRVWQSLKDTAAGRNADPREMAAEAGSPLPDPERVPVTGDESAGLDKARPESPDAPAPAAPPKPDVKKLVASHPLLVKKVAGDDAALLPKADAVEAPKSLAGTGHSPQAAAEAAAPEAVATGPTREQAAADEMARAQQQARNRGIAGSIISGIFGNAGDLNDKDRPVNELLQRRDQDEKQRQIQLQKDLNDPQSARSRAAQGVMVRNYGMSPQDASTLSAADLPMVKDGYGAQEIHEDRAAKTAMLKERYAAEDKSQAARDAETARHNRAEEGIGYARIKGDKDAAGKTIPARSLIQMEGVKEMQEAADELDRLADKTGVGAALTPGDNSNNEYTLATEKAAHAESKAVSGGSSESAAKGFKSGYLGSTGHTADAYHQQAAALRRRAQERAGSVNEDLGRQGYIPPYSGKDLAPKGPVTVRRKKDGATVQLPPDQAAHVLADTQNYERG